MLYLEDYARKLSLSLIWQAQDHYAVALELPSLHFDLRGATAGEAVYAKWRIRLNHDLLKRYRERFVEETVPHEVAHLVAFRVHGGRIAPHGDEWREVMALYGADARRCHAYEIKPTRQLRTFRYHCSCGEHWLTTIRHNRVRSGTRYQCVRCNEALVAA